MINFGNCLEGIDTNVAIDLWNRVLTASEWVLLSCAISAGPLEMDKRLRETFPNILAS
jgi:hypothetical protein